MFFSIHRYGHGFYPGTGAADETGTGPGLGRTLQRAGALRHVAAGLSRRVSQPPWRRRPTRSSRNWCCSAPASTPTPRDPIGSLGLEVEDFAELTKRVLDVARTHAGGRLVSCLEGGYNLEALAESVQAHLEELLGAAT